MSKYAAILCASWDPSSPPWRGREGRTGRGSGSAGAGGCSSWAQEDGSAHHHFQEGFVAVGAKGKLRCAFKPEVFQVQIRSVSRRSPGQHFAIAVGTCCEMEENFEIAFACKGTAGLGAGMLWVLGHSRGAWLAAVGGTGPADWDCQAWVGDNPTLTSMP